MAINPINTAFTGISDPSDKCFKMSFATMPDNCTKYLAYKKTELDCPQKKFIKKSNAVINSLPLIGAVSTAALTKGSLFEKSFAGGANGLMWLTALGISGLYGAAVKAVEHKSHTIKKSRQNHPVASFFADCAIAGSAIIGATFGLTKAVQKINVSEKVVNWVNNSKLATNFIPTVKNKITSVISKSPEFIRNSVPFMKKAGKSILRNAPLIAILGVALASVNRAVKEDKIYCQNYRDLKDAQLEVAQNLLTVPDEEV